ncbi:hypothetical protein WAI453_012421 [Rhynchosporium graminicola]
MKSFQILGPQNTIKLWISSTFTATTSTQSYASLQPRSRRRWMRYSSREGSYIVWYRADRACLASTR